MSFFNGIFTAGIIVLAVQRSVSQDVPDPCLDGNALELNHMPKRSSSFALDSAPLCDRFIREDWYKNKGYAMATSPPALGFCGTLYPVWLSGTIPPDDETQTLNACEVGFSGSCTRSYEIGVKNCSSFLVYRLKAVDVCNSAYCFEPEECVNETISNVQVLFHNITWDTQEVGNNSLHDPSINLLCSFDPSDDDTVLYHIDWYVDNDTVIQGQTVDKDSLQDAILSARDMKNAGKKINSWIHCIVGLKMLRNREPCFTKSSELFFAGIEVLNHTITIERDGEATLMVRPTIPFASETIEINYVQQDTTPLYIQLSLPENASCENPSRGTVKQCSTIISSWRHNERHMYDDQNYWKKIYTIPIINSEGLGYYIPHHTLSLRFQTGNVNGQGAQIFANAPLHNVQVYVVEKNDSLDWRGKKCGSFGDPHQLTFDGYWYECQETGCITGRTYILYRNEDYLQEVQVRHEICWGSLRCICAVAVRAGQDVFTIDTCGGTLYINFPICNENALKVIKESDKDYKVIFPTGTLVKIDLFGPGGFYWYSSVTVYPVVTDVSRTSGLCGFLDSDPTNDLRRRNGTEEDDINIYNGYNHPDNFSLSWQIPQGSREDLLAYSQAVYDQLAPISSSIQKLCSCENGKTRCSYKQYNECKTKTRGKVYHCVLHSSSRKRRDLHHAILFKENSLRPKERTRFKRQVSEIEAYDVCNEGFQQSSYYNTCLQFVPNFSNDTFVNCIKDITMTGDKNLTQWHLSTALGQCKNFVALNSTFQTDNPDVTTIIESTCPNNCSNRGECERGACSCEYGYGGSDCSFDVLSPPTITRISDNGICDKSDEECNDITLYGHYFVENMGTTCYVTRQEVDESNSVILETNYSVELEERTLFEGYCSLQYASETRWATIFHFNLSTDNIQFSETYTVFVYQSQCQTFHNDSGEIYFTLQNGYCFIDGACIQDGTFKSNDSCLQCIAHSDLYVWTWGCNRTGTTESSVTTLNTLAESTKQTKDRDEQLTPETIGIIIAVAAAFVLFMTIVTVVTIFKKCINNHKNETCDANISGQDEFNIYPKGKECIAMKESFDPANLWKFESPKEKYSRPPSASSMRDLPPTHDFSRLYDQQYIDQLFSVSQKKLK